MVEQTVELPVIQTQWHLCDIIAMEHPIGFKTRRMTGAIIGVLLGVLEWIIQICQEIWK